MAKKKTVARYKHLQEIIKSHQDGEIPKLALILSESIMAP
jgi:hypothetical protein